MEKEKYKEIAVRTIDELGRVVLPLEIRHKLDLGSNDKVRIIEKNGEIVFEKYKPSCTFCGTEESLVGFNDKYICKKCSREIKKI